MSTLTARQIIRGAYSYHTFKDDRTIAIGKLDKVSAWEINFQPSNEEFGKPYSLHFARVGEDGYIRGSYIGNFATLAEAEARCTKFNNDKE